MSDPCALTATALLEGYRKRTLSPVEVAQAVLKRIEALNSRLNAFLLVSDRIMDDFYLGHIRSPSLILSQGYAVTRNPSSSRRLTTAQSKRRSCVP